MNIGLSDYAITAYLTLLTHHPVNGSQLSRLSGIPRARVYDVLRSLMQKGYVTEVSEGAFIPLPPEEMIRRLRVAFDADLAAFEERIRALDNQPKFEFIWTIKGYACAMDKAREMVRAAREEIYIRIFPEEARHLEPDLLKAESREVQVKYIAMKPLPRRFTCQIVHPEYGEGIESVIGGRSFDLVVDRKEILGGMLSPGREDQTRMNWGRNRWFVLAGRDSLRHDFFHYFLHRTYHLKQPLSREEEALYQLILKDG